MRRIAFRRRTLVVDPIGWDGTAGHDTTILPGGHVVLHHSTCWCRTQITERRIRATSGRRFYISEQTVKTTTKALFRSLGAKNR